MAKNLVHLSQANHNEQAAKSFLQDTPYHDWAITAAFYASIHFFEWFLTFKKYQHSETSIPTNSDGKFFYTVHAWREKLIKELINDQYAFKAFRKLRIASEHVRYLSLLQPSLSFQPLDKPAFEFYDLEDASALINNNLAIIKKALQVPISV